MAEQSDRQGGHGKTVFRCLSPRSPDAIKARKRSESEASQLLDSAKLTSGETGTYEGKLGNQQYPKINLTIQVAVDIVLITEHI